MRCPNGLERRQMSKISVWYKGTSIAPGPMKSAAACISAKVAFIGFSAPSIGASPCSKLSYKLPAFLSERSLHKFSTEIPLGFFHLPNECSAAGPGGFQSLRPRRHSLLRRVSSLKLNRALTKSLPPAAVGFLPQCAVPGSVPKGPHPACVHPLAPRRCHVWQASPKLT